MLSQYAFELAVDDSVFGYLLFNETWDGVAIRLLDKATNLLLSKTTTDFNLLFTELNTDEYYANFEAIPEQTRYSIFSSSKMKDVLVYLL